MPDRAVVDDGMNNTLRCVQWNGAVCVSGICRCPVCGGEKWCYAARHRDEPEPPCSACKDRANGEKAQDA